jgi:hypothetical protein
MPKILDPLKRKVKEEKDKKIKDKKSKKIKPEKPFFRIEHGLFIVEFN